MRALSSGSCSPPPDRTVDEIAVTVAGDLHRLFVGFPASGEWRLLWSNCAAGVELVIVLDSTLLTDTAHQQLTMSCCPAAILFGSCLPMRFTICWRGCGPRWRMAPPAGSFGDNRPPTTAAEIPGTAESRCRDIASSLSLNVIAPHLVGDEELLSWGCGRGEGSDK